VAFEGAMTDLWGVTYYITVHVCLCQVWI